MLSVLIVDDEQIEREGMRAILERTFPEVNMALAKHGQAAVELVPQFKPDLIIMDIKMPVMNGLEAIECISAVYPNIRYIMVTAYDTFEYARQAIKLGVKDYILKPSKIAEIQAIVGRVLEQIKQERKEQERQAAVHRKLNKVLPIVEADIVTQLLFDHVHEVHLDEMISLLDETMSWNKEVFVLVIRIHSLELADPLLQAIKLRLRQSGTGWVGAMSGGCLPIIGFLEGDRSFRSQAASIVRELVGVPELNMQRPIHIGIGDPRHNLNNARYSYQEALLAAAEGTDQAKSKFTYYSDLKARDDIAFVKPWGRREEKQMQEQLRLGQWEALSGSILHVVDQLEASGMDVYRAQQHMLEGLWIVFYELSEYGIETELPFYPFQIHAFKQLRMETERLLLRMREDADTNRKQQSDVIQSIKHYIMSNSHQELSLEIIAKEAGLSPFYISKLFKEQVGIGYIDFLTECRIEKAKKMMGTAEYSLKEIAYEVGFNDPNYFSKVFKKVCGLAPTDYRKAINGIKQ